MERWNLRGFSFRLCPRHRAAVRATSTGQLPEGMRTSFLPGIQDIAYGLTDISHRQVAHTLRQRHTWKQHLPDTLTRAWNEERGDQNRCQKIMHQSKIHSLKHPAERWSSRNSRQPTQTNNPSFPPPPHLPHTGEGGSQPAAGWGEDTSQGQTYIQYFWAERNQMWGDNLRHP